MEQVLGLGAKRECGRSRDLADGGVSAASNALANSALFFFCSMGGDCLGIEGQEMAEVFKDVSQSRQENAKVRRRTL